MKTLGLIVIRTEQIIFVPIKMIVVQIVQQQIKLLIKRRLWLNMKFEFFSGFKNGFGSQFHHRKIQSSFYKLLLIQE